MIGSAAGHHVSTKGVKIENASVFLLARKL
jgi:hypothetical protein